MRLLSLKTLRESGRKRLFVIPCFFTMVNALLGLLAVIVAVEGEAVIAAYCITVAALMDMLDGRIARAFHATSLLGTELDSLCDAISFCLAPTIMLFYWPLYQLTGLTIVSLLFYFLAGLYRLARFNVAAGTDRSYFRGLPTTVAAVFFASFVMHHDASGTIFLSSTAMAILVTSFAMLMISPVAFPAGTKGDSQVRRHVLTLSVAAGVGALVFGHSPLFIGITTYVVSSMAFYFCMLLWRMRVPHTSK